jgi:prevent-host-death family protein
MDVAVTNLRANLSHWLDRVLEGDEVVVTEHGVPIARLLAIGSASTIERLTEAGVIGKPERSGRTKLGGRPRPRPRRPVADIVSEQRG